MLNVKKVLESYRCNNNNNLIFTFFHIYNATLTFKINWYLHLNNRHEFCCWGFEFYFHIQALFVWRGKKYTWRTKRISHHLTKIQVLTWLLITPGCARNTQTFSFHILMSLKDSTVGYKLRERLYISVLKLFSLGSHRACVMNMTRQLDLLCGRQWGQH